MPRPMTRRAPTGLLLLAAPLLAGCSLVTGVAVNSLAEVLAEGEAVYRSTRTSNSSAARSPST